MKARFVLPKVALFAAAAFLLFLSPAMGETPVTGDAGQTAAPPGQGPVASFEQVKFEFPEVLEGTPVVHDFVFKNTGVGDLVITDVKTG